MNFFNSRCLLVVFISAVVLVIVNGQSTTDDDNDKDEISCKLIESVTELQHTLAVAVDRIAELEDQLATYTTSTRKPDACKFSYLCILLLFIFIYLFYFLFTSCDFCSTFLIKPIIQPCKISNMSVRPTVRYIPVSDENGLTYRHCFFTVR